MNDSKFSVSGKIVDVVNQRIFSGIVEIENGKIKSILEKPVNESHYIMPGFIDSHVHIESSMLIPSEFARLAVVHGTVATVSDPHEIANVLGVRGVNYMIENGKKAPFKFFFGAPSCVPATPFETSGSSLGINETEELLKLDDIYYLAEMMNFPGVLNNDAEVMQKLALARKYNKVVDGHAPGLVGDAAEKYAKAGISTDHECFTTQEAIDKINFGIKVLIREGSAAKNFDDLISLLKNHPDDVMFCSDDKHPNDLVKGHMNLIYKRALALGHEPLKVLKTLSYNPVKHYSLNVGLLQPGDDADFIITDNLADLNILKTYIKGTLVAEDGKTLIESIKENALNIFNASPLNAEDIAVKAESDLINVIGATDGQLITKCLTEKVFIENEKIISDTSKDILKIVVLNRYNHSKPAVAFINGFGFRHGAIASTVAHDSHNIIAVGVSDEDIVKAINLVIAEKGGISVVAPEVQFVLPLPVAGLMSNSDGYEVARKYEMADTLAKKLGSLLTSPFMTLSFMALLVIPKLKISDKGLFNGNNFTFTSLFFK
jgi:adenine deaminase